MGDMELWSDDHNENMIGYHLVWCTKYRHEILKDGADVVAKHVIAQTCADNGWSIRGLEVMPDHVHLFIQAHPTDRPCDIVRLLKSTSAVAVFHSFPKLKGQKFWGNGLWDRGTYYGSVGDVSQETVQRYISEQKKR